MSSTELRPLKSLTLLGLGPPMDLKCVPKVITGASDAISLLALRHVICPQLRSTRRHAVSQPAAPMAAEAVVLAWALSARRALRARGKTCGLRWERKVMVHVVQVWVVFSRRLLTFVLVACFWIFSLWIGVAQRELIV